MSKMERLPKKAVLNNQQQQALLEARVSFMKFCPFFCHYYYDQMVEYPTFEVGTLATDAKRVFINPDYFMTLTPMERAFTLAHEVNHSILKHPQRMKFYASEGKIKGLPYDSELFNISADYAINAHLVDTKVGACHPSWLYDSNIKASELAEDVYVKLYKNKPPPPVGPGGCPPGNQPGGGGGGGQFNTPSNPSPNNPGSNKTYRDTQKSTRHDKAAEANGGTFDTVLEPFADPTTGSEDAPDGVAFVEAVARAAAAAKAMGNLPGSIQRMVDEILTPTVDWREHLRMLVVGKLGARREDWQRPNRRRIVLDPIIIMPGKRGHGSNLVVCVVDNSGSVGDDEMSAFFAEMVGIVGDCRPREVMVIWCDAQVREVATATCLDELSDIRVKGSPGGGGTSFIPPFEYLEKENIKPDTLVYLTDMEGRFPEKPNYPVVWAATTDREGPFGETVRVKLN